MSALICPSGHHANKTPRQRQRAGPPSSTWPPCPSEPRGCGRTGRRTGESGTAALERTSSGRTEPPPSSDPPAGRLCSSFRAELTALLSALQHLLDHPAHTQLPVVICTDSQSALAALREGPMGQKTPLSASRAVWGALASLAGPARRVHLQWVPSHCGVACNERRRHCRQGGGWRSRKRASRWTSGLPTARPLEQPASAPSRAGLTAGTGR